MGELPIKHEDAVAFFRFQVISEMLDARPGFVKATANKLAGQQFNDVINKRMVTFSERTIFRYYSDYKKDGFDGLKPKRRCDRGTHPGIDESVIRDILSLKKELPTRSAAKIITMLELARRIPEESVHLRTANRILNQYGYTRETLSKDRRLYIKHEKDRICAMWQSDVMSAFTYLMVITGARWRTLSELLMTIPEGICTLNSTLILHFQDLRIHSGKQ